MPRITALLMLAVLSALAGSEEVDAARTVAVLARQTTPRITSICGTPHATTPCLPRSIGGFPSYFAPGTTTIVPPESFTGSVSAPPLTFSRCKGFPKGTFCTQTFRMTIHTNAAGKVISTDGGVVTGSAASFEHLAAVDGGTWRWCATSLPCASLTSLPGRIFTDFCGNKDCSVPELSPLIVEGGINVEKTIPGYGELQGQGTFFSQIQLSTGAASPSPSRASLTVTLSEPPGATGLSVGATESVTGKVTAKGGAVSAITLRKGLVSSSANAVVTGTPAGLGGFALTSGASRSFVFTLKGAKAGAANLTLAATGKAGSRSVHGSGALHLQVGRSSLAIRLVTTPSVVALTVDDTGKVVPKQVAVKVTFTNNSQRPIKGVQLLSLNPEPVDPTQALDHLAFSKGTSTQPTFPIRIGTIAAGASSPPIGLHLTVTGDGKYQLRALALFSDPATPGGNGRLTAIGGQFEATVPPLFFSTKVDPTTVTMVGGEPYVKGGATWYALGTIKDESSFQHLCVSPIAPSLVGNAAATGPVDITAPGSVRQIGGPFAGALRPGEDVSLSMFVDTSRDGATLGKVAFAPKAALLDANGTCTSATFGGLKKLAPADLTIPKGGAELAVHVNLSQPLVAPANGFVKVVNFYGGYVQNLYGDTFDQVLDVVALARSADSTPAEYKLLGTLLAPSLGPQAGKVAQATVQAAQAVYTAGEVYASYWRTASAADKQSVFTQAASVLSRVGGDFWSGVQGTVIAQATPFMNKLETAYATGDDATVWRLWGNATGSVVQQVVTLVVTEVIAARVVQEAPQLEKIAAAETKAWEATEAAAEAAVPANSVLPPNTVLETVPPGSLLGLVDEEPLWGIDATADTAMGKVAVDNDVVIGVRGRSPGTIQKLERGSVWKNEKIKPKNVNDIDVNWLGFNKDDLSEVRFRTYTPEQEAAIRANVANSGLSDAEQAAIIDRLETRLSEKQYVATIEGFSKKGQINVGFNYRDNGVNRPSTSVLRKFDLESYSIDAQTTAGGHIPAGGTYYTPYQENPAAAKLVKNGGRLPPDCKQLLLTVLCTITGDTDGVYITNVDGGPVPKDKLLKVYAELQAAGWQHPETLTWINDQGQFYFGKKKKILQGLEQGGGESMVEFGPDGKRRATYLDLDQSSLLGTNDYYVRVVGGYTDYTHP